jgi:hypothetical protein
MDGQIGTLGDEGVMVAGVVAAVATAYVVAAVVPTETTMSQ